MFSKTGRISTWSIIIITIEVVKVTEGVSGQQGISGHSPSFRSLGAVFADNCTALEASKVRYACVLTIISKNC